MKKIYFLCNGNTNRAKIAEGFARTYLAEQYEFKCTSSPEKKPLLKEAIIVMNEIGIDIAEYKSFEFSQSFYEEADMIVSIYDIGQQEEVHHQTNAKHIHLEIAVHAVEEDFLDQLRNYREVRDQIGLLIKSFSVGSDLLSVANESSPISID